MFHTEPFIWRHHLRTALTMTIAAAAFFACSDQGPDKSGTFFGPSMVVGNGTARSYVTLDRSAVPTDIGVALTEATLTGLPVASAEFLFTFPSEASATPYSHAVMNWWVSGHGPAGSVYAVPHFDVHFYMVSQAARETMVLGDATLTAKMVRPPTGEFVPSGYVPSMAVAKMGMHWTNSTAPEFNGQPFTHTFLYGSYDGGFMLSEPMVTKAFLETKPSSLVTPLKLPAQYATRGYQATSYTVGYDAAAKEYRIALSGLIER